MYIYVTFYFFFLLSHIFHRSFRRPLNDCCWFCTRLFNALFAKLMYNYMYIVITIALITAVTTTVFETNTNIYQYKMGGVSRMNYKETQDNSFDRLSGAAAAARLCNWSYVQIVHWQRQWCTNHLLIVNNILRLRW